MTFAIIIGVEMGPMVVRCESIEMLLERMRTQLKEPDEIIHEIGSWALHADRGDCLDWDRGWIFAVAPEDPFVVRDEHAWKAKH